MDEINIELLADDDIDITPEIDNDFLKGDPGPKGDKGDKRRQRRTAEYQEYKEKSGETGEPGYTPVKGVDYFTPQDIAEISYNDTEVRGLIQANANDITQLKGTKANINETGRSIMAGINSSTFVLTIQLRNKYGYSISSASVDLPLGSMVIGGSYDSENKEIVLSLKDGSQTSFSIAALVNGLQSEITSNNKLSSDLVDDTNQTNKFVTSTEKTTWNAKLDASKVKTSNSTTSGDVYDVTYINSVVGDIETLLNGI